MHTKEHFIDFCSKKKDEIKIELDRLRGKTIVITGFYNGQPYGTSKRNLQGEKFVIEHAMMDTSGELYVLITGHSLYLCSHQWEFAA